MYVPFLHGFQSFKNIRDVWGCIIFYWSSLSQWDGMFLSDSIAVDEVFLSSWTQNFKAVNVLKGKQHCQHSDEM